MKIDYVKKDDEHKVMIRAYDDDGGGVILLSVSADANGLGILAVDAGLRHITQVRVGIGGATLAMNLPTVEIT